MANPTPKDQALDQPDAPATADSLAADPAYCLRCKRTTEHSYATYIGTPGELDVVRGEYPRCKACGYPVPTEYPFPSETAHEYGNPRLTTSDGAREILAAGGRVHRDERYTGDYRYIVDYDPRTASGSPCSAEIKRQCCRKCLCSTIPAVTLTFDHGTRALHWCADCADDADKYRDQADSTEPAMTRDELAAWLRLRGVREQDIPQMCDEYAGRTEAEMDEAYEDTHGWMA